MAKVSKGYHPIKGSEPRHTEDTRRVGLAHPNETLTIRVCLRQRPGAPPLPDHAYWTATPPGKRRFLSAAEFAATHGAAQEDLSAVAHFAHTHGLVVVGTSIAGRTVALQGTVDQISRAFDLEMGTYHSSKGAYRSHEGSVRVPDELADVVTAIFGLDNRRSESRRNADPAGTVQMSPVQVAQLYNFPPTPPDASGQVIGVMEFSGSGIFAAGWNQSDIDDTMALFGAPTFTPLDKPITGSNTPGSKFSPQPGDGEVILDICVASAAAPGAAIWVYWGTDITSATDWIDLLNGIIADPPTVLSNSNALSSGDDAATLGLNGILPSQIQTISDKFQSLAAMGVTVFSACGDDGSRSFTMDKLAHLQYPGSDPWVTSCGGTTIGPSPLNVEWVWNDNNPNSGFPQATGGGVSAFFVEPAHPLPAWQQGVVTQTSINDGTIGRGVPDVAGNASVISGYQLTVDGILGAYGGTSAVAPLYAGLMALIVKRLGQQVGFLNPTLYAFRDSVCRDINDQVYKGSPPDNGVPGFTDSHSRTYPAVKGYPSGPGWDACTGLGVIDGGALLAALQGVFTKDCQFIADRTQIGRAEVQEIGTPASIPNAFYVVVDGFSASDLSIKASDLYPNTPAAVPTFTSSKSGIGVVATALLAEDVSLPAKPQRFTWVCSATFPDLTAFASLPATVTLKASKASVSGTASVELVAQADPYELDGPVSWLSTDLRVFQLKTNGSLAGLPSVTLLDTGNPSVDAPTFIKGVVSGFNANPAPPPTHPFDLISTDEQVSQVTLNQFDFTTFLPIYNFAVARVRYESSVASSKVRVFFRLYQAATTSTAYEPQTYAAVSNSGVSMSGLIPVVGVDPTGNLIAIPCFADPRVTPGTLLSQQTDDANVILNGIQPASGGGVGYAYFGCWLDINQPTTNAVPKPPVPAESANPWANGSQPVLAAIRSQHQCLISEISYDADPVVAGQTPASSDKLAQRNLMIVPSANPGNPASHRIPQTFDIRPTPVGLPKSASPDELMIQWGNTPPGSFATLYLPGVSAAQVLEMATKMYPTQQLQLVDEHTLSCRTGGATWMPVPQSAGANFAGLLTVDLPATVRKGQVYTIVVRQMTNATVSGRPAAVGQTRAAIASVSLPKQRRVLGSFQLTIPVDTEGTLLEPEERLLAILRWIDENVSPNDRWSPVFDRYLAQIAARVQGFGGNPSQILPSPTGSLQGVQKHGGHEHVRAFTGKVAGLIYDHFGDFDGFILETGHGEKRFKSREAAVQRLTDRAWRERILITVMADPDHHPVSIVLREYPLY
jgi:hypothetical protein